MSLEEVYSRIRQNRDSKFSFVLQATLDTFLSLISVQDYYTILLQSARQQALKTLVERFLNATPHEALWCILLQQFEPPGDVQDVIQEVQETFRNSMLVPTGLRLKSKRYGNNHIVKDKIEETQDVSRIAMRIVLLMTGAWFQEGNMKMGPEDREAREMFTTLLRLQVSKDNDPMTVIIAAKAVAHGIPVDLFAPGPAELREQHLRFAMFFISSLHEQLSKMLVAFFNKKKEVQAKELDILQKQEGSEDAQFEFKGVLYEVASKDDEDDLPVPLSNYMRDSSALKEAYTKKNKIAEEVVSLRADLGESMSSVFILASCCRLLFTLCSIIMHALVFERSQQVGQTSEEEQAARRFLCSFDWNIVLSFGLFERSAYNSVLSRLWMTCASRCFADLQDIFSQDGRLLNEYDSDDEGTAVPCPIHSALRDLNSSALSWYPPNRASSVEGEDLDTVNLPSLDTRISTSLCYWGVVYNLRAQKNLIGWKNGTGDHYWMQLVRKAQNPLLAVADVTPDAGADFEVKDTSIVRVIRSFAFPQNHEAMFETSKPVSSIEICAHFAEYNSTIMADGFLSFSTLEGNCLLQRRGLYPLDVVELVYSQSRCNLKDDQCAQLLGSLVDIVMQQYSAPKRDALILTSALNLLCVLIQGRAPSFRQPAVAPIFQHLLFETSPTIRFVVNSAGITERNLSLISLLAAKSIYDGEVASILPIGVHNLCPFGLGLRTLTTLALIDAEMVWDAIQLASSQSSFRWSIAEKFAKKENEDPDDQVFIPLQLALEGGSVQVLHFLSENMKKRPAEQLFSDAHHSKFSVRYEAVTLLSTITSKVGDFHTKIIARANYISAVMSQYLDQLAPGSRLWPSLVSGQYPGSVESNFEVIEMAEQMLLFAYTLIASGRPSGVGGGVPYSSPHNVFLRDFGLEGHGILVANELAVYAGKKLDELKKAPEQEQKGDEWNCYLVQSFGVRMLNATIFSLEFMLEMCTRRPEIQTFIAEHCKLLLEWIPAHIRPHRNIDDFHVGIAELCCRFISTLCLRNDICQDLVLTCGCVEGMMDALGECVPQKGLEGAQRLAGSIVLAIQQLVVRNKVSWLYVQRCSGVEGLLQLCQLGNLTIKNLCCSTLMDKTADWDNVGYGDSVASKGGIAVLNPLLRVDEDETTIQGCLRLVYTLCINSKVFRTSALDVRGPGAVLFSNILALLRRSKNGTVLGLICNILSSFGSHNPTLLRKVLQSEPESLAVLVSLSSGKSGADLVSASVTSLACMTVSEDSEYPTGAPFLRQALSTASFLPALR